MSDGIVLRASKGLYTVQTDLGRILPCRLRGNLKKSFTYTESGSGTGARKVERSSRKSETDAIAVGDRVDVDESEGTQGIIEAVYPRRASLSRQAAGREHIKQTLVANLELAVITFAAAEPRPDLYKLDRFLVMAEDCELTSLIVLNKCELATTEEIDTVMAPYIKIGYTTLTTSAKTGQGIEALRGYLSGRISAFCGPSGVGKSSLLNALQPGLELRTREVGDITFKGRHTTTGAELIPLGFGGWVADTPGLRQVEFWDLADEDIPFCFPEMAPLIGNCKFADCKHRTEPGCVIRAAVEAGEIDPRRYQSYLEMI